jgi:hypothetical protein
MSVFFDLERGLNFITCRVSKAWHVKLSHFLSSTCLIVALLKRDNYLLQIAIFSKYHASGARKVKVCYFTKMFLNSAILFFLKKKKTKDRLYS